MTTQVDLVYQYCEFNMTQDVSFCSLMKIVSPSSHVLMKIGKFPLSKQEELRISIYTNLFPIKTDHPLFVRLPPSRRAVNRKTIWKRVN